MPTVVSIALNTTQAGSCALKHPRMLQTEAFKAWSVWRMPKQKPFRRTLRTSRQFVAQRTAQCGNRSTLLNAVQNYVCESPDSYLAGMDTATVHGFEGLWTETAEPLVAKKLVSADVALLHESVQLTGVLLNKLVSQRRNLLCLSQSQRHLGALQPCCSFLIAWPSGLPSAATSQEVARLLATKLVAGEAPRANKKHSPSETF
eukprot:6190527-Pleurochrysis_carterae.AAC.2